MLIILISHQKLFSILYTVSILRIFRDILNSRSNWAEGDWTMCLLLTTESVVVVVRSPPKTGPYVVFTLDWDLRIIKVMFASFQGNTRTTNLNCSQYNEWIPAKRRKPTIWRWSIFCNLWEIVFVSVRVQSRSTTTEMSKVLSTRYVCLAVLYKMWHRRNP